MLFLRDFLGVFGFYKTLLSFVIVAWALKLEPVLAVQPWSPPAEILP